METIDSCLQLIVLLDVGFRSFVMCKNGLELLRGSPRMSLIRSNSFDLKFGHLVSCFIWLTGVHSGRTWLILPVVICLSQRLSHACLSISFHIAKLRMAH